MSMQEKWTREVIQVCEPGDERLLLILIGDRAGSSGIARLDTAALKDLLDRTGMSPSQIREQLNSAEREGWIRVWVPAVSVERHERELIVELIT